ncbi:TetR/AcrR family transcriptional regulator [Nocardioides marmorisolisilvae]|uniref:TetR/AcrR family transcriptional regulator n=1 Tax=Nocardioides marmorisolisilvae TaxID=1542737 RepID=A0A3N0E0S9_9ACTN|nr:TetR/AcrR family transcriptional regulator [Nocardioides marmorisolisilvae]RNL81435.1 TetR/AcrR family transcriptional regulator [Nocardioides marmorisolisilvae]
MTTRREQILETAAALFAQHGFHGVSIADLGAACGFSGPALYKHFRGKQAILSEMLVSISEELLREGRQRVRDAGDDKAALESLIAWHVDFALAHKPLIVVQDRDWSALPLEAREKVRDTQRKYVDVWVKVLRSLHPEMTLAQGRATVHAAFGLINSTPHSALVSDDAMRPILTGMAFRALLP